MQDGECVCKDRKNICKPSCRFSKSKMFYFRSELHSCESRDYEYPDMTTEKLHIQKIKQFIPKSYMPY